MAPNRTPRPFSERVYARLLQIPEGRVTTYAELARSLGIKGARAVGQALNKNPNAPRVPCHRVVRSDGSIGGYAGGVKKKVSLLSTEGIQISESGVENFDKVFFRFRN
jgi:methylated-DNA-[protein]-cysteine S-methyltransferase